MLPLTPATVSRALFAIALTVTFADSPQAVAGAAAVSKESVQLTPSGRVADTAVGGPSAGGQAITAVAKIKALSVEDARRGMPLHLTATVTYVDPRWKLLFVEQDGNGVF